MENYEKDLAVLIGVDFEEENDAERSLDELERLAETAGVETALKSIQRRKAPSPATYIGRGKAEEIAELCKQQDVNIVIVDDELKGSQIRELEDIFDMRVIDRTTLILDIFASRATSLEGSLQVELAQLIYRLLRLTGIGTELSRLGGGIGTRGPGETKLESDRRHIRRRILSIQQQLDEIAKRRELSRKKRAKDGAVTVALVGYTNAGKSSLMNALCENAGVYVQDQLFATLDPTIRRLETDGEDVLLVDTVGFIRKLPHTLVNAFSSTLEESLCASLLLIVVDSSDSEAQDQLEIVSKLLYDLGASDKPALLVLNKCDIAGDLTEETAILSYQYKVPVLSVSAVTGEGLEELKKTIIDIVFPAKVYDLVFPYSEGGALALLHDKSIILNTEHMADGTHIKARINNEDVPKFERFFI
ncbi:MAG: GTPase HflX [Clostridiales bacterium]|nr:MAG: GTPase HflX [Clostridiales bacterium]